MGSNYLIPALETRPLLDERTWVDRSLKPLWSQPHDEQTLYYAVHHPSFARIAYGTALRLMGVTEVNRPAVDYSLSIDENMARGAYVPLHVRTALRLVNVAFLSGMVALLYFGFKAIRPNRALALAACLPFLFNYPIIDEKGVCPYIGTDAFLLFWLVAFWFVWVRGPRGWAGVLVLALTGGMLISTKVNGVFTLAGACVYFALREKGFRRAAFPLTLAAVAAAVFVALNPVYRAGDIAWAVSVLRRLVNVMLELKQTTTAEAWGQFSRSEVIRESFPYWFFLLPSIAVIAAARKADWFGPTAAWATATLAPNLLLIYMPLFRYSAVITVSFLVLFMPAGIALVVNEWKSLAGRTQYATGAEDP